jgi:hypothetical protein
VFNTGYHSGHHDTVEGGYVHIEAGDMDSYHDDEVKELVADLREATAAMGDGAEGEADHLVEPNKKVATVDERIDAAQQSLINRLNYINQHPTYSNSGKLSRIDHAACVYKQRIEAIQAKEVDRKP